MSKTARTQPQYPAPTVRSDTVRDPITVVGIGSEFRGDDAVGLDVLRKLKAKLPAGTRTAELTGDQSDLLELMRSTDAMIIVDAVRSSAPAGTVFRIDAGENPVPEDFVSFSTHAFDSAGVIEMARVLGSLPETLLIYGIVGGDFSFRKGLTPEVEEVVEIVCAGIVDDAVKILAAANGRSAKPSA